jgi:hypothetical protein
MRNQAAALEHSRTVIGSLLAELYSVLQQSAFGRSGQRG